VRLLKRAWETMWLLDWMHWPSKLGRLSLRRRIEKNNLCIQMYRRIFFLWYWRSSSSKNNTVRMFAGLSRESSISFRLMILWRPLKLWDTLKINAQKFSYCLNWANKNWAPSTTDSSCKHTIS
jgi:hypothetical protein